MVITECSKLFLFIFCGQQTRLRRSWVHNSSKIHLKMVQNHCQVDYKCLLKVKSYFLLARRYKFIFREEQNSTVAFSNGKTGVTQDLESKTSWKSVWWSCTCFFQYQLVKPFFFTSLRARFSFRFGSKKFCSTFEKFDKVRQSSTKFDKVRNIIKL